MTAATGVELIQKQTHVLYVIIKLFTLMQSIRQQIQLVDAHITLG